MVRQHLIAMTTRWRAASSKTCAECGYQTLVVDSGDAAIAMLTAPDAPVIDAVVLDLVMPGLDGNGRMAKIREAGLSIPVVVQTAMAASTMCVGDARRRRILWSSRSASSGCSVAAQLHSTPAR